MHTVSRRVKAAVVAGLAALVGLQTLCFFTSWELYPMAPFTMYSNPFDLPVKLYQVEVTTGENVFTPVFRWGEFDEAALAGLLNAGEAQRIDLRSEFTQILYSCRQSSDCLVRVGTGMVSSTSLKIIRGVKNTYASVEELKNRIPSQKRILVELRFDQ